MQSHWHFVMFKSSQLLGALLALLGHVDSGPVVSMLTFYSSMIRVQILLTSTKTETFTGMEHFNTKFCQLIPIR